MRKLSAVSVLLLLGVGMLGCNAAKQAGSTAPIAYECPTDYYCLTAMDNLVYSYSPTTGILTGSATVTFSPALPNGAVVTLPTPFKYTSGVGTSTGTPTFPLIFSGTSAFECLYDDGPWTLATPTSTNLPANMYLIVTLGGGTSANPSYGSVNYPVYATCTTD
jgi:hypothetical protein